jgi:predicted nucleic acid-binding protein
MLGSEQICDISGSGTKLSAVEQALALICLVAPREDAGIAIGLASDVLSEVLARAVKGCLLVTALSNLNAVAVAAYTGIAAIIITSGYRPSDEVVARARAEGIGLYATPAETFDVVGKLSRLGIQGRRC